MSFKMTTTEQQLNKFFELAEQEAHKEVINTLAYLGEQCISKVREGKEAGLWTDRTGNLRSSIGYVVVYNGQIVELAGFNPIGTGIEGQKEGRTYAEQLAKQQTKGYALIVVAGMAYASYVEAKGFDVLANTALYARQEAPKLAEKLEEAITKIYDIL